MDAFAKLFLMKRPLYLRENQTSHPTAKIFAISVWIF